MEDKDAMGSEGRIFLNLCLCVCFVIMQYHSDLASDVFCCEIRDLPINKSIKIGYTHRKKPTTHTSTIL